jgi:hypothetical protein
MTSMQRVSAGESAGGCFSGAGHGSILIGAGGAANCGGAAGVGGVCAAAGRANSAVIPAAVTASFKRNTVILCVKSGPGCPAHGAGRAGLNTPGPYCR